MRQNALLTRAKILRPTRSSRMARPVLEICRNPRTALYRKALSRFSPINQETLFHGRKPAMFNEQLLAGRRILVTGGGTGLGKSMAARFLELGAEVHICGRRKGVCDETATELMDLHGGRVTSHGVDIRNPLAVDEMIETIFTEGPLTDLINNA